MTAGLVAAAVVVAAPFLPATENVLVGAVLLAFALGWALLALLSTRFSDQPQRWAVAPAVFLAVVGLGSILGSAPLRHVLSWVWPPALALLSIWMFTSVNRHLRSRIARCLLLPVIAALAIASVGGGYETVRESLDAKAYPMPGKLVDVGGHRLHLRCTGSGSPTVVLEPGLGGASSDLAWIEPAVARDTRVCVYDRAGRGWSDPTDDPQDAAHIATDLHTLLDRAHVPGPYVLAGHSFGGLYVLSFAAKFPDQVAGLVLLDSTAPKAGPAQATDNFNRRISTLVAAVGHLGAGRLIAPSASASLPPRPRDEARANSSSSRYLRSYLEEFLEGSASVRQAAQLTNLNGRPLIVLTADTGNDATWRAKQDQLATLSTNSLHRMAIATTHESLLDDQGDSAAASQAIHDVVAAVRTSRPLGTR